MRAVEWDEASAEAAAFLAIVPPAAVVQEIEALQAACGVRHDFVPHITVKAQPGLEGEGWREAVRRAVIGGSVRIELAGVGWFGDGIVFLQAHGDLVALHSTILRTLEAIGVRERFEYEGPAFEPHLTLAARWLGATDDQLDAAAAAAADRRWAFEADELVEFARSRLVDGYAVARRYPLTS